MAMYENWQVFVHDGRHNHTIGVYTHGHTQATKLTEEQLIETEQFRKSHVPPRNILQFFREQNVSCAASAQKIYNVVAKIKKHMMQGRNTVEEVLSQSAKLGYMVFYGNCADNNVLSDIIVAHPTSIEMMRMWPYILIMDTTLKQTRMTPTGKNFTVAIAFIRNEQAMTYRWVLQQIKHLYFSNTMSTENQEDVCVHEPKASLEFSRTKENFNAKSNQILRMISTGSISKVREMRRLAKGVLSPVLPEDPGVILTSPPEVAVTKGRKKTNSTKKDKSHWEHVSIAHRKIQKLSGSGSGSSSGSGSGLVRVRDLVGEEDRHELLGEGVEIVSVDEVVADFVFGDEHQWLEVRRRMLYELEHATNMYLSLLDSAEHVHELVHSKYIQFVWGTNCTAWFTTMLPLYSYSDHPGGILVIGLLAEHQHFIQIYHRSERVSNWADSYYERIEDWNARRARNRN
ncbi:hypothetical protein M9H77_26452 [Catharanthus roseus]|uniref:Uncharacterized protein n=1 Tax=Catharanthus roseus TaxID=4058 RepID=A0ACC0ABV4_CATRO|nr:hypothetical protein M9H77_26452 [Catharanthus roseus]